MEIFCCTFLIKLHYVKLLQDNEDKKRSACKFQALLKGAKNHIIASGNSKPTLLNDTAWFNQTFQIKSDLLLNPQKKAFSESTITLQVKCRSNKQITSHLKTFSLAEVAKKSQIPQKQYQLTSGLIASVQLICTENQSKGIKPLRNKPNPSPPKSQQSGKSFLLLKQVSFKGDGQNLIINGTPKFSQSQFEHQDQLFQQPLVLEDSVSPQLKALQDQFEKQRQEHQNTKQQLKIKKVQLQQQYNINRELNNTVLRLQKKIQEQKSKCISLQNHLSQMQNICTALSVSFSKKQTQVFEVKSANQELKQQLLKLSKRNEIIDPLQRAKAQLQWQAVILKKECQALKIQLNKLYLTENDLRNQIQRWKGQYNKLKKIKQKLEEDLSKLTIKQKDNNNQITKQVQQIESIKRQTAKWRAEFAQQSQRKQEEINHLQNHYSQIFHRYSEILKKLEESSDQTVKREVFQRMQMEYQKKFEQYEQKEGKLRQQLQVIEQEIQNLQELLQEKEQNEEILFQQIKKLKNEVENYAINDNWWVSILQDQKQANCQINQNQIVAKLQAKNKKLVNLLHKNSSTILEGERLKLEIVNLKKDHEQLIHKQQAILQQSIQIKQKIGSLYKQNKKLQQKNFTLSRQRQQLLKKNVWLEEQIGQSKASEKQARQDYEIISFQLFKIGNKQKQNLVESVSPFLTVIKQTSEQQISSTRKIVRESSIKESTRSEDKFQQKMICQLQKILQERSKESNWMLNFKPLCKEDSSRENFINKIQKLLILSTKIKTALVKIGLFNIVKQWESSIKEFLRLIQDDYINK